MLAFRASSEQFLRRKQISVAFFAGPAEVGSRVHVGNVEIPDNKKRVCDLQCIKGIGHATARQLFSGLQFGDKPTWQLTAPELETLRNEVLNYNIGQNLDKKLVPGTIEVLLIMGRCPRTGRSTGAGFVAVLVPLMES